MAWTWRMTDSTGAEVEVDELGGQVFPAQSDAESWVGEVWRELLDRGVAGVTLLEDGREVYGPMSLHS